MILSCAGRTPRIAASAFVAESADIVGDVEIGENASIWFQTVLRGDVASIRVGANSNVQDGSIAHGYRGIPVVIGDGVTVGHRVVLHACTIENQCLVGMGAVVLNNARIGEGSIVAAGALVLENTVVPPRSLYLGVPARFQRQLSDADRSLIETHATHYLEFRKIYLAERGKNITR